MYAVLKKINKPALWMMLILAAPSLMVAEEGKWAVSEQSQAGQGSLYAEIAIGVVFVAAVTVFLIWKAKHDRKVREKQMEQMKKVQAAKRRAA